MWPLAVRRFLYPIHEWVLRRPTGRFARELEESQWMSPTELRDLQHRKLRSLLLHAQAHTPFYRERLCEAGIDPRIDDPNAAIAQLPILDKEDIRQSLDQMVWRGAPGGLFKSDTGGSSGRPLIFYVDRRRQACDQAARIRSHRWFDVDMGEREVYLWGSPIECGRRDRVRAMRDRLQNHLLLNAFNMSSERMDRYLDEIERFRPACLFGYPSSLALLAEHGMQQRSRIDFSSVKCVFVTGEVCFPHYRETIKEFFKCRVADGYGSRDAGFIAHECREGNFHLTAENLFVEIVKDGGPAKAGEAGEIVVTHLDAYAMPMIRYRTGDMGRLKAGRCECGRGLPMLDMIEGRSTDFLYLPDGTVKHALSIIYPLRSLKGMRQFRVTQHENYDITVAVVRENAAAQLTSEVIAQQVQPVLGKNVKLNVSLVERIEAARSGKYRYVVSDVPDREGGRAAHVDSNDYR